MKNKSQGPASVYDVRPLKKAMIDAGAMAPTFVLVRAIRKFSDFNIGDTVEAELVFSDKFFVPPGWAFRVTLERSGKKFTVSFPVEYFEPVR